MTTYTYHDADPLLEFDRIEVTRMYGEPRIRISCHDEFIGVPCELTTTDARQLAADLLRLADDIEAS